MLNRISDDAATAKGDCSYQASVVFWLLEGIVGLASIRTWLDVKEETLDGVPYFKLMRGGVVS